MARSIRTINTHLCQGSHRLGAVYVVRPFELLLTNPVCQLLANRLCGPRGGNGSREFGWVRSTDRVERTRC
jgi:hypothetical protein